jgi:cytochrome c-type biogenesis protein CcmH/NrfF
LEYGVRRLWPVVLAVAVAVVVAGLFVGHRSPSRADRVEHLAGELRCPTCAGQSVADSTSPVAASMRSEVAQQVRAGRSDGQILGWFRGRYGDAIVLAPPTHGLGWILWLVPGLVLLVSIGVVLWRRRPPPQEPPQAPAHPQRPAALSPPRLAVAGLALAVAGVGVPLLLTRHSDTSAAATPAPTPSPSAASPAASPVEAAFQLLQAGHPADAESLVRPVAARPGHDRALAILVLGLAQRAQDEPTWRATLTRFLEHHPRHPAAAQVRRLLQAAS